MQVLSYSSQEHRTLGITSSCHNWISWISRYAQHTFLWILHLSTQIQSITCHTIHPPQHQQSVHQFRVVSTPYFL